MHDQKQPALKSDQIDDDDDDNNTNNDKVT
jgi:hypothetical protein